MVRRLGRGAQNDTVPRLPIGGGGAGQGHSVGARPRLRQRLDALRPPGGGMDRARPRRGLQPAERSAREASRFVEGGRGSGRVRRVGHRGRLVRRCLGRRAEGRLGRGPGQGHV